MPDTIRTCPTFIDRKRVIRVFSHDRGEFYFTFGRACAESRRAAGADRRLLVLIDQMMKRECAQLQFENSE